MIRSGLYGNCLLNRSVKVVALSLALNVTLHQPHDHHREKCGETSGCRDCEAEVAVRCSQAVNHHTTLYGHLGPGTRMIFSFSALAHTEHGVPRGVAWKDVL